MKDFGKFLKEEVELSGNRGVPDDFMSRTDQQAAQEHGFRRKDVPPTPPFMPPNETGRELQNVMRLVDQGNEIIYQGRQEEVQSRLDSLEELAENVIMELYGDILDNVILDLKIVRMGEVHQEIDFQNVPERPRNMKSEWIDDIELAKKVDAQKIMNNITQGEGLNTKHILHMPFVRDGIQDIFGPDWRRIFNIWDEITKTTGKIDWLMPIPMKAGGLANAPQHMGGAVKVTWEEEPEEDENQPQEEPQEYQPEEPNDNPQPTEYSPDDDESEFGNYTPKIVVRAVDFPMLLHEAVKGIYELISAVFLPDEDATEEEKKEAETIKQNTSSMTDEAEDHRYGPYIASALRDAVNECDGADDHPSMRAFVFGKLVELAKDDVDAFLRIMKKILSTDESAKSELEALINDVNDEIDSEQREYTLSQLDGDDDETPALADGEDDEVSDLDKLIAQTARGEEPQQTSDSGEVDYSKLSQSELSRHMDAALDNNDFELAGKIGKFMENQNIFINKLKNYLRS